MPRSRASGRSGAASSASTGSSAPRPTSGIPTSSTTTTRSSSPLPEDGYHLTADLTDRALSFIQDSKAIAPDKPFFLYYCPGACHAPHHAPKEWADKYKGKFDMGYEAYRELIFERQKKLGIVTEQAELSPINPYIDEKSADGKGWPEADTVRPWDSLSDDEKRLFARMAEVYAGFLSHADHEIGRLLDYLEECGQLDNTIIVLVSDNGASGEGGPNGSVNENKLFNGLPDKIEENLPVPRRPRQPAHLQPLPDRLGVRVQHAVQALEALRKLGGRHRRPDDRLLAGEDQQTGIRRQFTHAVDIVPTLYECSASSHPRWSRAIPSIRSRGSASPRRSTTRSEDRQADAVLLDGRYAGDLAPGLEGRGGVAGGARHVGPLRDAALGAVRHRRTTRPSVTTSPPSTRTSSRS